MESMEGADPAIRIAPSSEALDPRALTNHVFVDLHEIDLIHLNHHDGLHSRWTPEHVTALTDRGIPVVVTYHDTRSGEPGDPNSAKAHQLLAVASSMVVHEPCADLRAIYWRQGVPAPAASPYYYAARTAVDSRYVREDSRHNLIFKAYPQQPVLGTVGFNFPWKNYNRLAQITGEEGWALLILSNNATQEDAARWHALNPDTLVVREFLDQPTVTNYLAGCDATAFMYECANTGTSGAIRQGIAARKPVIALRPCRQFRDLFLETETVGGIDWVEDWTQLRRALHRVQPHRWQSEVLALAHRESWTKLGANYAQLYRSLTGTR